ncbi:hypothetical protein [Bradyrhizobium elkanii]|uniref:hypothetical protein n=1 Tax=Bradyrhizobium elkanii TaxID=29448 RepID=UPI003D219F40
MSSKITGRPYDELAKGTSTDDDRDIIARLRWPRGLSGPDDHPVSVKLRVEAADEIGRLRQELQRSSELSDDRVSREEMLEAMREQRINLGGMHDKTLAELKRVREVAAEEINRLEGEVRSLRIDNARLRDEAAIRALVSSPVTEKTDG